MNDWPRAMAGGGVPASHGRISEHPKQKKKKRSGNESSLPQRETRQGLNLSIQQRVGAPRWRRAAQARRDPMHTEIEQLGLERCLGGENKCVYESWTFIGHRIEPNPTESGIYRTASTNRDSRSAMARGRRKEGKGKTLTSGAKPSATLDMGSARQ